MRIVTVVGARPQFVKAGPVSRALKRTHTEIVVHTGQHYDPMMSDVFFDELAIPAPDHHLGVGSGPHGSQTGEMLSRIEVVLQSERPDRVLVYGDTNSTLAGALAAAKLRIPVVHVEAGLRSFVRSMPEEINRVLTDHLSSLLLAPSETAVRNLAAEGITRGVALVGDVMSDALLATAARARAQGNGIVEALGLRPNTYALATCHRAENTDDPQRLSQILDALGAIDMPVVLPLHPRTRVAVDRFGLNLSDAVTVIEPVGYVDMVSLESSAALILTDSGGMQKEAYWLGVPCVTMRNETEWVETVESGWNRLAGTQRSEIVRAATTFAKPATRPPLYGAGEVAPAIVAAIEGAQFYEESRGLAMPAGNT